MTLTCDFTPQLVALREAVGYVRLSVEAGDRNRSLKGMQDDLIETATRYGYHLTEKDIFVDDGYSGAIRNRPQFLAWLEAGRQGKTLITWSTDRLTREGINVAGAILDVVEGKDSVTGKVIGSGVRYLDCFGTDSDNEDAFRFKFAIDAEVARAERRRIQRRNLATQARLREAKVYRGGAVPFGYRVVPHVSGKGKALEVDPAEATLIRQGAKHILQGGTLYSVLQTWREAGVKPHRAEGWSLTSVRAILIGNPVLGRQSHQGRPVYDEAGNPVVLWEPILTLEQVEQIRAQLKSKGKGRTSRRKRAARLLSGLLECHSCGGPLRVAHIGKYVKYVCNGGYQGRDCQKPVYIQAEPLEELIEQGFLSRYGDMQAFKRMVALREATESGHVQAQMEEISRAMVQPGADIAALAAKMTELSARRTELDDTPTPITTVVDLGCTMAEDWAGGDLERRREWLRWAFDDQKVVVRPTSLKGRQKFDPSRAQVPWRDTVETWVGLRSAAR